jgi:hypothetical protein
MPPAIGGLQTCLGDRQTGLHATGITTELLRLTDSTVSEPVIFFSLPLKVWWSGLLCDHPPSMLFSIALSLFFPSISILLFSPSSLDLLVSLL